MNSMPKKVNETDPMQSHYLRVPVRIVDDDRVGRGEVETQTAGARAERACLDAGGCGQQYCGEWEEIVM